VLERPRLRAPPACEVAQAVHRDRVEPGPLTRLATDEGAAGGQDTLEGVGEDVLRERHVSRAVDEVAQQVGGVVLVESLEVVV
jgi:hypothetical protein